MKYFILYFLIFSINIHSYLKSSQPDSTNNQDLKRLLLFTFDNAEQYVLEKDFRKAVWIYINLFPSDCRRVIREMNSIKKNFSEDIKWTVLDAFGLSIYDPEIFDGKGVVNTDNMNKKGKWGDDLIAALESGDSLCDKNDYLNCAIKTKEGYLFVRNDSGNYFTLEIKGEDIHDLSQQATFSVDGIFLQILTVHKSFLGKDTLRKPDDKEILELHRDWELKYLEEMGNSELRAVSSWEELSDNRTALFWYFEAPENPKAIKKQIFLTLMKGQFVLVLGSFETDLIDFDSAKKLLMNSIATLKVYNAPINTRKLQDSIRNEGKAEPEENPNER